MLGATQSVLLSINCYGQARVLVPPRLSGLVTAVREGPCPTQAAVASVAGVDVPLRTSWPVRRPRLARERLEETEALSTGQRVLDLLFPVSRGHRLVADRQSGRVTAPVAGIRSIQHCGSPPPNRSSPASR